MELAEAGVNTLREFLVVIGTRVVLERTTAILGQMLLEYMCVCVIQVGNVMFMLEPQDVNINPPRLGDACVSTTAARVLKFDGFQYLHETDNDFFDEDGVDPEDED